jgi:hypothetical protein
MGTARRHRRQQALTVAVSIAVTGALVAVIAGRWDEFVTAITAALAGIVAIAVLMQLTALLARSEAWNVCVQAAGATVSRRRLYRASSMGYVGSVLNSQLGVAARIAALRRSAPGECPRVPALIAAELPIVTVEATLAALTSFTLVGPLGLPWWAPVVCVAATVGLGAGWAGLDRVWSGRRAQAAMQRLLARASRSGATGLALWTVLAELPAPRRTAIERAYFGGLSHIQIGRALRVPSAA